MNADPNHEYSLALAGKSFEEAGHEQKLKPTADNLDTLPTLPTDNGDAGDHVVKEKGTGLQAAAAAAAELEEAITDEKPSGEVPTWREPDHRVLCICELT